MAAELLSASGIAVHLYDTMPSVGRKFLLAGLGGLNLTHAEPSDRFVSRYAKRSAICERWLHDFDAQAIRDWAKGLGVDTFVGSSQRVFPTDMKAAPLLRAWLHRLRHPAQGHPVTFHMRHRWAGNLINRTSDITAHEQTHAFELQFETPQGLVKAPANAVVLALGGGSWARLGSDGAWVPWLQKLGVDVAPLRPANCGFDVQGGWSDYFQTHFAGHPLKSCALSFTDMRGHRFQRRGEFVVTTTGVEGSLIYAASALLRDAIDHTGSATLHLDLLPNFIPERVLAEVSHPRGSRSLSSHLKSRLNLNALHLALLHEVLPKDTMLDAVQLAHALKNLPITLGATRPLDEAISTAGGVTLETLDAQLMTCAVPGLFTAGEMLDWEAPTGGYLLSACLASGRVAAHGVMRYLGHRQAWQQAHYD
jgi:uncharacterized flavoprotein (TIGR03862 family)